MPRPAGGAHGLWRPGAGLTLWFTDEAGRPTAEPEPRGLPAPVRELVDARAPRRSITLTGPDGRIDAPVLTLGPRRAAALLAALAPDEGGGDLQFLSWVAASMANFVAAGAVVPALSSVEDEWHLRWVPLQTLHWRAWTASAAAALPEVLRRNGDLAAVLDLAAELTDLLARAALGDGPWGWVAAPSLRSLVSGDPVRATVVPDRARAAGAWANWGSSVRNTETALMLALIEPGAPGESVPDGRPAPEVEASPWRLQVCRRVIGAGPEPVWPADLSPVELDDLTGELARAFAAWPPLRRTAQDPYSLDLLLTTVEAEQLLTEGAARLGEAGCEVLLPATIATVRAALKLRGREQPGRTELTVAAGLAEIRDFNWRLALGDVELTPSELRALARGASGLVRLRGNWVRADAATLRNAARFVAEQRCAADAGTSARLSGLLELIADPQALPAPLTAVDGLGWLDSVYRNGAIAPVAVPSPPGLQANLRPYQRRGLDWLAALSARGIGAVLADDMGLGKTIQVLALLCHERRGAVAGAAPAPSTQRAGPGYSAGPGPTLLVGPMSVVGNWAREAARFTPGLRVHVHHGPDRLRGPALAARVAGTDLLITTFALASRDRDDLTAIGWQRLVVDEAQHVKNVNTLAARALRAIGARHRVALTGTPVENRLEDLRAVIDLVNPGLLGSARTFRNRYALPIEREHSAPAAHRLTAMTSPFILRRVKTDPDIAGDLPAKDEFVVRANLTAEQAGLYQGVLDRLAEELRESRGGPRRGLVLGALTRLKQVCNHPAHYLGDGSPLLRRGHHRSGKVELLGDIVEAVVAEGERALLFTQYAAFAELLAPWLAELCAAPVPVLRGSVPREERDALVARFQAGDGAPLLLATVQSGGTGINLTAANHVVHLDRWWNPAVENQATDRAFRIGQTKRVQVRKFVCVGTLEERIDSVIAAKRELVDLTVSTGESWLGELGDDELLELMALGGDAVGD